MTKSNQTGLDLVTNANSDSARAGEHVIAGTLFQDNIAINQRRATQRHVPVFFYGSFINPAVLAEVDIEPRGFAPSGLDEWTIRIDPLATISPDTEGTVYGVVADCTHSQLERLYAQSWVGTYLPEPVTVYLLNEQTKRAVITYVKWEYRSAAASVDYVERIAGPAASYGFPADYISQVRSFLPTGDRESSL